MATSRTGNSLNGDAPPFVPGQREHASYVLPSNPLPQPWGYGPMPPPYPYHQALQYTPFGGYQPVHGPYPPHGYNSYYGYYYPQAAPAPWYPPNTNYVPPMYPYANQFHQVQGVQMDGAGQQHNGHYDYRQNNEGGDTYAKGNARKPRAHKKKGKKGKKYRQEKKRSEKEREEEGKKEGQE